MIYLRVIRQPAAHHAQLADGDPIPVGDARYVPVDRIVETNATLVHEFDAVVVKLLVLLPMRM